MTHNDASQSVVLLWTSDRPDAEIETWQHTTLTGDRHPCTGGIRTRSPSKREAADPCLVPRAQFMVWHKDGVTLAVRINWSAGVGDVTMDPTCSSDEEDGKCIEESFDWQHANKSVYVTRKFQFYFKMCVLVINCEKRQVNVTASGSCSLG